MNVGHLLRRLAFAPLALWEGLLGCPLPTSGALLVLGLMLGLYKSRNLGLRNQYTHSFSIIDGPWF